MWYYQENYQRIGPIDSAEVERLIREGQINRSTKVWREGMTDWQPAIQTELRGIFLKSLPPPIEPPPVAAASRADDDKRLNTWFMGYWICLAAIPPVGIAGFILPEAIVSVPLFIVVAFGSAALAIMFGLLILRKLWSLIPANQARTTPSKAVGFLFIPLFNLYWIFIAIHGLAKTLNIETSRNSIKNKKVNEALSLSLCIAPLIIFIGDNTVEVLSEAIETWSYLILKATLGWVSLLALSVLGIITLKQMKNAGIALVQKQPI